MDNQSPYSSSVGESSLYGLQLQMPSYQSEMPNDFPYDPGATSSLFELNYLPSNGIPFYMYPVIFILLGVVLFIIYKRVGKFKELLSFGLVVSLLLSFFGPLNLPSLFHFRTVLGLSKLISGILCIGLVVQWFIEKKFSLRHTAKSITPLAFFLISQLLSVFTLTNMAYFLNDFGILMTGILFMFLSYNLFSWKESANFLRTLVYCLLFASTLVIFVFMFTSVGVRLINALYPRYENFVFLHDLERNRIFSIIDFEYFTPCLVFILFYINKKKSRLYQYLSVGVTAVSMVAIVLVNYRYRFLTYISGFITMFMMLKAYRKQIAILCIGTLLAVFSLYLGASFMFSRSTIIDRFLMKSYADDVTSVERRFVMYRQAIDVFFSAPLLGVGTGNYKDNVQIVYSDFGGRTYEPFYKILQNVYAYPHNWFLTILAENGIVGLLALSWLLLTFIEIDVALARKLHENQLLIFAAYSSISWLYVFANMFTMMHVSLPMVIVFWSMRGFIERMYQDTRKK
jgi:O-antigen ligase